MNLSGLSIIGQNRATAAGQHLVAINPATGLAVGPGCFEATPADVDAAMALADQAFMEFRRWSGKRRQDLLNRIAQWLEANREVIVELTQQETALSAARLQGELARTCFQLRLYGEAAASGLCAGVRIDHGDPHRQPQPKPDLRSLMVPVGPVVVFGASNFPLAFSVAGGDTASALAAGCPVIVKPHPGHPGTAELVGVMIQQAARECGAPAGVFSMLFGGGPGVGMALVKHPLVKAVGFTGSRRVGRALMDAAAARPEPVPVYAEMSSINPVFVLGGVLSQGAEALATGLHGSVTLGVGQMCTSPGVIFVEAGEAANQLTAKLARLMAATAPGTMLTAGIGEAYRRGVEKFAQTPGVKVPAMVPVEPGFGQGQEGAALFVASAETWLGNPALREEIFGPATLVVECASAAQMLAAARLLEGQLTAAIHALPAELAAHQELVELMTTKAGRVIFNGYPTGVEVAHAMTHGGPYPATADGRSTSVGTRAIERFLRPVSYQNFPDAALPAELQEANPLRITRLCDGKLL